MNIKIKILVTIFFLCLPSLQSFCQEGGLINKLGKDKKLTPEQVAFADVETALSTGNVSIISRYLSPQTYFSLSNGVNGYYSSNQAYYVLEDFFKIYQVISFKFNLVSADLVNPYATGVYHFDLKGKRNSAQVFVAFKKMGDYWKITQLTIN